MLGWRGRIAEEIKKQTMHKIRYLDKLIDELANKNGMENFNNAVR